MTQSPPVSDPPPNNNNSPSRALERPDICDSLEIMKNVPNNLISISVIDKLDLSVAQITIWLIRFFQRKLVDKAERVLELI